MNKITAVIFDWDNTLFPFKKYWEQAHQEIFVKYKFNELPIKYEDFMHTYREIDKMLWQQVLNKQITLDELRQSRIILTLKHYGISFDKKEAIKFYHKLFEILLYQITPDPVLINQVQALKTMYQITILTNGKVDEQTQKIERFNFKNVVPYYISEAIGFEKPDSRAFDYVIKALNVSAKETVMIGDSIENDILPAQQLGMTTIYVGHDTCYQADYTFDNISEAVDFLLTK